MIIGIGIDIIEINRIKKNLLAHPSMLDTIFTKKEIEYCSSKKNQAHHFAARYACKEAFLKAIGTGWRDGIKYLDIEITNDRLGAPVLTLYDKAKSLQDTLQIKHLHLSISHTGTLATAIVILEN